jgi:hypothetical protein
VAHELQRLHPHSESAVEFGHHIYLLGHPDKEAGRDRRPPTQIP